MQRRVFTIPEKSSSKKLTGSLISLTATSGDTVGEIDLAWEPVPGAYSYIIQKSSGFARPAKWIVADVVSKSSCTIPNLKSRHYYWFRIASVKSKGQGPWSKPIQKKAP
jgi:hypothetical protein